MNKDELEILSVTLLSHSNDCCLGDCCPGVCCFRDCCPVNCCPGDCSELFSLNDEPERGDPSPESDKSRWREFDPREEERV